MDDIQSTSKPTTKVGERIWGSSVGITRQPGQPRPGENSTVAAGGESEAQDPDIEGDQGNRSQQKRTVGITEPSPNEKNQKKSIPKKKTAGGVPPTRKFGAGFNPMGTGHTGKRMSRKKAPIASSSGIGGGQLTVVRTDEDLQQFSPIVDHYSGDEGEFSGAEGDFYDDEDEEQNVGTDEEVDSDGNFRTRVPQQQRVRKQHRSPQRNTTPGLEAGKVRMVTLTGHHAKKGLPSLPQGTMGTGRRAMTPLSSAVLAGGDQRMTPLSSGAPPRVPTPTMATNYSMHRSGVSAGGPRAATPAGVTSMLPLVVAEPIHEVPGHREDMRPQLSHWPAVDRPDSKQQEFNNRHNAVTGVGTLEDSHSSVLLPKKTAGLNAIREQDEQQARLDARRRQIAKTKGMESWAQSFGQGRPSTQGSDHDSLVPSSRRVTSPGGVDSLRNVNSNEPPALQEILAFRDSEIAMVRPTDLGGKMRVYKEVLLMMIDRFTSFAPLLKDVSDAFDGRLQQCETLMSHYMLGDKTVQLEKEKYLSLQADALENMEKERHETAKHRKEVVAAEQKLYISQQELGRQKDHYELQLSGLRKELIMERAVRRDEAEGKQVYAKLHNTLRERWEEGSNELNEFKMSIKAKMYDLEQSERKALAELTDTQERMRQVESVWAKKFEALSGSTVNPEEYNKMAARSKKVLESLRVLEKKVGWLQADLDAKADYEVAVPWKEIGPEYDALKSQGRSSEGIVRIIMQKLSRAQKYERQFFTLLNGLMRMRDYLSSSDYGRLSSCITYEKKQVEIAKQQHKEIKIQAKRQQDRNSNPLGTSLGGPAAASPAPVPAGISFSKGTTTRALAGQFNTKQNNTVRGVGGLSAGDGEGATAGPAPGHGGAKGPQQIISAMGASTKQQKEQLGQGVALGQASLLTAVTPEFQQQSQDWKVPSEVKVPRLNEVDHFWAPKTWTAKPLEKSSKKINAQQVSQSGKGTTRFDLGAGSGTSKHLLDEEHDDETPDYSSDPEWCNNQTLDYETVKSLCVCAFIVSASQGSTLCAALESVAKSHFDFTSQTTFFSNWYYAASQWFHGDPFISLFLVLMRGDKVSDLDRQLWKENQQREGGNGGNANSTLGQEISLAFSPGSKTQKLGRSTLSSSGAASMAGSINFEAIAREQQAVLKATTQTARTYSVHFLNQLRLLYTCFEKTEKLLMAVVGTGKSTGTLPRKVLYECLQQCLPHKTARQLVRLQHIIHTMCPSASLVKNTFYRDLMGHFGAGKASPLLVELADQYVDELTLFRHIVIAAIQQAAREESEGRISPASVTAALKAYTIHPKLLEPGDLQHSEAFNAESKSPKGGRRGRKQLPSGGGSVGSSSPAGGLVVTIGDDDNTNGETPLSLNETKMATSGWHSFGSGAVSPSSLPHANMDNLSVVEEELPSKLVERWVAYCFVHGKLQPVESVAPPDPSLADTVDPVPASSLAPPPMQQQQQQQLSASVLETPKASPKGGRRSRRSSVAALGASTSGNDKSDSGNKSANDTPSCTGIEAEEKAMAVRPPAKVTLGDPVELPRCGMMEELGSVGGPAYSNARGGGNSGDAMSSSISVMFAGNIQPAMSAVKARDAQQATQNAAGQSSSPASRKSAAQASEEYKAPPLDMGQDATGNRSGNILRQSLLMFATPGGLNVASGGDDGTDGASQNRSGNMWFSEYQQKKVAEEAVDRQVHDFVTRNQTLLVDTSEFVETLLLHVPLVPMPHIVIPSPEEAKEFNMSGFNAFGDHLAQSGKEDAGKGGGGGEKSGKGGHPKRRGTLTKS